LFRVKSDIPGLGFLEKVEPFRIIIKGDKISEMKLADIKGMERVVNVSAPAHAGASSRTSGDEFVKEVGDGAYVLNQKMVQESINNPQRLMTDARLLPLYRNGKQEGFALNEVKPGGIYDSLGLKNGDVLLRINEYNITNPEAALQAFTALRGVDRLQLDIQRNNTAITMTYDIK
jgi:general secretion pathway protein C